MSIKRHDISNLSDKSLGRMTETQSGNMSYHKIDLRELKTLIEVRLEQRLPDADVSPTQLHAAERHAVLGPAGRIRPILCYLVAKGFGVSHASILDLGCAVEFIHTASLILDDLPCMDDADLRRSRPSTHIEFDESTAVLAAISLLNRAYHIVSSLEDITPLTRVQTLNDMAESVGSNGLIAGQIADLKNTHSSISPEDIERLNRQKTAALFQLAMVGAARFSDASPESIDSLNKSAISLGIAFQLIDDFKDIAESDDSTGKSVNRDTDKMTLINLEGPSSAQTAIEVQLNLAKQYLRSANLTTEADILHIIDLLVRRLKK